MIDVTRFAAIAESIKPEPTDTEIATIADLARRQQRLERALARREKLVELTKGELAKVAERELPDAMAAVGMSEFSLDNGFKVSVAPEYFANIPSPDTDKPELLKRRVDALKWLRDHEYGDLIKCQIVVDAGRGEQERAARVMRGLDKAKIPYRNTESIHFQTLRAFVKEQLESNREAQGTPFPEHLFGVHVKRVATVKPASRKKQQG